jgi:hypothetical protein
VDENHVILRGIKRGLEFLEFGDHHDVVFVLALENLLVVLDERNLVERGNALSCIGFVAVLFRGNIDAATLSALLKRASKLRGGA